MIYTVTMNPAIDYRMTVSEIVAGHTNRSLDEAVSFGGKGINVSRVLAELGVKSRILGICSGFTGKALAEHLDTLGADHDLTFLDGERNTRINVKLKNPDGTETEVNAAGPSLCESEVCDFIEKIKGTTDTGDTVILSGSVPKGAGADIYARIMQTLSGKNIRFVVDVTGDLLKNTLKFSPFLIKPNTDELSELTEKKLETEADIISAATKLKESGARNVLVSMGAKGAILVDENGKTSFVKAHSGKVINTVGAGDSMVAGFVAGCDKGYEYALKLANACGGATAFSEGLATKDSILKLM